MEDKIFGRRSSLRGHCSLSGNWLKWANTKRAGDMGACYSSDSDAAKASSAGHGKGQQRRHRLDRLAPEQQETIRFSSLNQATPNARTEPSSLDLVRPVFDAACLSPRLSEGPFRCKAIQRLRLGPAAAFHLRQGNTFTTSTSRTRSSSSWKPSSKSCSDARPDESLAALSQEAIRVGTDTGTHLSRPAERKPFNFERVRIIPAISNQPLVPSSISICMCRNI